jgi:hypothetical protein
MKTHQIATVESIHPHVEEEITLRVGDVSVVCFHFSGGLEVGRSYNVALHLFEWQRMRPAHELALPTLTRLDNSSRYDVVGRLSGCIVDAGILLVAEEFATEAAWLDGKMVHFEVDRIDLEIIDAAQ